MARRIEIELTSARDDGTWTWRAAGAKQPKGVLDACVLYEGAKVGDVVRAEADFEIDGITILTCSRPRRRRPSPSAWPSSGRTARTRRRSRSSLVAKRPRHRTATATAIGPVATVRPATAIGPLARLATVSPASAAGGGVAGRERGRPRGDRPAAPRWAA